MNFVREAKGYTSDHVAFNGTARKVSLTGPFCARVSVFVHMCACLNVTRSTFQWVSQRSQRSDFSDTVSIQQHYKTFEIVKKSERSVSDLLSGSLKFMILKKNKGVFCTVRMNSHTNQAAFENTSVTEFRGHMCPDLNAKCHPGVASNAQVMFQ